MLLSGRNERRLPIMVVVNLAHFNGGGAEPPERTYTDNISVHGARVQSTRSWHPGEHAEMLPVKGEPPVRGEVVYCERRAQSSFFIGLKFPQMAMPWSIFRRYDGVAQSVWLDWTFLGAHLHLVND